MDDNPSVVVILDEERLDTAMISNQKRTLMETEEQTKRSVIAEIALLVGVMCFFFVAALISFVVLGFLFRLPLTIVQPFLALGAVLALPFLRRWRLVSLPIWGRVSSAVAFVLLFLVGLVVATSVLDVSCDGQGYHGTAIVHLLEGWNPLWNWQRVSALQEIVRDAVVHFAKGPWYAAAGVGLLTGTVEAGKSVALLLTAGCGLIALHAFLAHSSLRPTVATLLALLVAINPVNLSQILTNYVDGQGAVLFTCVVLGSCLLALRARTVYSIFTALAVVLLMNVKLNAVPYVCVFGGTFALALFFWKRRDVLGRFLITYAAGITLGVLLGMNPYVFNLLKEKNPFYPFSPSGKKFRLEYNVHYHQMPVTFRERNRFERLFLSAFSRAENDYDLDSLTFQGSQLKVPFTLSRDEIAEFQDVDVRISGWGPLIGGILLLSLAALLLGRGEQLRRYRRIGVVLMLCVLATIFVVPHTWAARYVPQLWLIPVIAVVLLWLSDSRFSRGAGAILSALMIVNLVLVGAPAMKAQYLESRRLQAQLKQLSAGEQIYAVSFGDLLLNRQRFREAGIRFREAPAPGAGDELVLAGDALLTGRTVVQLSPSSLGQESAKNLPDRRP